MDVLEFGRSLLATVYNPVYGRTRRVGITVAWIMVVFGIRMTQLFLVKMGNYPLKEIT